MKYKKSQFEECFCQKRIIFLTHLAYTHPLIPASGPRPPTRMSRPTRVADLSHLVPSSTSTRTQRPRRCLPLPAKPRPSVCGPCCYLYVTVAVAGLWGGWRRWNSVAKRVMIQPFCRAAGRWRSFGAWEKTSRRCERS
jgi:hypothetical protein